VGSPGRGANILIYFREQKKKETKRRRKRIYKKALSRPLKQAGAI